MPSLGDLASRVRVRPLAEDEAYLLGALHLQSLQRMGIAPDAQPAQPGHVQAVAQAWAVRHADLPAWVAEHDGEHVGLAIARVPALPHTDDPPRLIHLSSLVAPDSADQLSDAVCLALVRSVVAWALDSGAAEVEVNQGITLPGPVLDAARADARDSRTISLPTRAQQSCSTRTRSDDG